MLNSILAFKVWPLEKLKLHYVACISFLLESTALPFGLAVGTRAHGLGFQT